MKDKYRVIVAMMIFITGEYVVEEKKKKKETKIHNEYKQT